jgi:membrane protease YdiL (CAAX protease family)
MLLVTMTPGIIVAVVYIVAASIIFPGAIDPAQPMMENVHVQIGLGLGIWIPHVLIVILSLIVLRVVVGRDWPRQVALRLPSGYHALLVLLLTPAVIVLANGVMILLRDNLGLPTMFDPKKMEGMGDIEKLLNAWPVSIALFVIAAMPALSEELWCRAFLGRGLVGSHGYVVGVLMTSFLFGLIHIDPCQGIMAASMGVILHFVYLTTRSLVAPMMLHFLNNATSVILSRSEWDFEPRGSSVPYYAAAALAAGAVCYALYESRARLVATDGGIPWSPPYPGVACPPRGSNTVIATPRPALLTVGIVFLALAAFAAVLAAIGVRK